MSDKNYKSLTERLIQNGIISESSNKIEKKLQEENPFLKLENSKNSIPEEKEILNDILFDDTATSPIKRLNEYDLELIKNAGNIDNDKYSFLNFKEINDKTINNLQKSQLSLLDKILLKIFPKYYRAKIAKKFLTKLKALNINTKSLFNKYVPYGENETRYRDLVKFLNCANEFKTKS